MFQTQAITPPRINKIFLSLGLLTSMLVTSVASAEVFDVTRYVKIDHQTHSGYMYDENFVMLPENPFVPGASIDVATPITPFRQV